MAEPLHFELVSPEQLLVSEDVEHVVVPGSEGYFTVLARHAPFLSTLKPGLVEVKGLGGEVDRIFVRGGFADVTPAGLTILADQAVRVADVDLEVLAQQVRDAEEDVADAKDAAVKAAAELKLHQLREVQTSIAGG
jgi:F-type H+-transporting ATPase subunit epsilon